MLNMGRYQLIVAVGLVSLIVAADGPLEVDEDCSSLLHYLYRRAKKHHSRDPPTFLSKVIG